MAKQNNHKVLVNHSLYMGNTIQIWFNLKTSTFEMYYIVDNSIKTFGNYKPSPRSIKCWNNKVKNEDKRIKSAKLFDTELTHCFHEFKKQLFNTYYK